MTKPAPPVRLLHQATLLGILLLTLLAGCGRQFYRRQADEEATCLIQEKSVATPWRLPADYSIDPPPQSRLYDSTDPDFPCLPDPGPRLYAYQLPAFSQKEAEPVATPAGRPEDESAPQAERVYPEPPSLPLEPPTPSTPPDRIEFPPPPPAPAPLPPTAPSPIELPAPAALDPPAASPVVPRAAPDGSARRLPPVEQGPIRLISAEVAEPAPPSSDMADRSGPPQAGSEIEEGEFRVAAVPERYWDAIPPQCLARMFEFESVRREYLRTFGIEPPTHLRDRSPRLTLENIIELSRTNSREYQTQKERLYQTALSLSLQRYDYMLKFSTRNNGVDANYTHLRSRGTTTNTLAVPSSIQMDKMLATGGDLLARFANDVVLTFNGPQGFTADVSSQLLFNFTQSILQRDILLEPLIQSERNLAYSARDFARFRKTFSFGLTDDYYSLLSSYRGIEIQSQAYFSRVRGYVQSEEEVRSGVQKAPSQIQVDQFEQSMLTEGQLLINRCNTLERSLDSLKLTMGIPTETPINVSLKELEDLTRHDEMEVEAERVRRWRTRLNARRSEASPDPDDVLNAAVYLTERLLSWIAIRDELGLEVPDVAPLRLLHARYRVDAARLEADRFRKDYEATLPAEPSAPAPPEAPTGQSEAMAPPPPPILRFQRTVSLVESLLDLADRQVELSEQLAPGRGEAAELQRRIEQLRGAAHTLRDDLGEALGEAAEGGRDVALGDRLKALSEQGESLLGEIDRLVERGDQLIGTPPARPDPEAEMRSILEQSGRLMRTTDQLLEAADLGLTPVEISVDDAMATALVQRFELINTRGELADQWRVVKITADDLRSVLDLNASQVIRTRSGLNRPFDFTFDDSRTDLRLSLDLPLNRKAQRNAFRRALISYHVAQRSLMQEEDNIKFQVRNDLRTLDLARVQYPISVTQAALAAERVESTRLSLILGLEGVQARDVIEALDSLRNAVVSVAFQRINYVVDRAQLALDLELLTLDDSDFWPEIRNDSYQPKPKFDYPLSAGSAYGEIPKWLHVSRRLRQQDCIRPPSYAPPARQESDRPQGAGAQTPAAEVESERKTARHPQLRSAAIHRLPPVRR